MYPFICVFIWLFAGDFLITVHIGWAPPVSTKYDPVPMLWPCWQFASPGKGKGKWSPVEPWNQVCWSLKTWDDPKPCTCFHPCLHPWVMFVLALCCDMLIPIFSGINPYQSPFTCSYIYNQCITFATWVKHSFSLSFANKIQHINISRSGEQEHKANIAYINISLHTYIHTYIHTFIHSSIHPSIHTYIHKFIHTYIHTYMHHAYIH